MILVKFDEDIVGTSGVDKHKNEVVFDSYAFQVARHVHVEGTVRTTGTSYVSDVSLSKKLDMTSPVMCLATLMGRRFKSATIFLLGTTNVKDGLAERVKIELTDPIFTQYSTTCSDDNQPAEYVSLNFSAFKYVVNQINSGASGASSEMSFDVLKGAQV